MSNKLRKFIKGAINLFLYLSIITPDYGFAFEMQALHKWRNKYLIKVLTPLEVLNKNYCNQRLP